MTNLKVFAKYIGLFYLALIPPGTTIASNDVPCLVFSGTSDQTINFEISGFNRIYFDTDSFRVSNTNDDGAEIHTLPFNLFHHLEIAMASPNISTGVEEVDVKAVRISYNNEANTLMLLNAENIGIIDIFNIEGQKVLSDYLNPEEQLSISILSTGVYIVSAQVGAEKVSKKIYIK